MSALLGLDLHGKRVVVAGGGVVATRRVRRFVSHGADVLVVAPHASEDITVFAANGDLVLKNTTIARADIGGAWLVLAATDNEIVNDDLARWCEEQQTWCINAANVARGTARMSAQSTHGDVSFGVISTYQPDPVRIREVRDAFASAIDGGEISLRRARPGGGRVILVGSGPGDPDLMTVKARRALAEADVVVTDRLGATDILTTLDSDVEIINVGKSVGNHPVPQEEINRILVDRARAGKTVVRFKGGDSFIFGRGGEEAHACLEAGVPYEVIPGITSSLSVPALAGISVTQRQVSSSVLVTSGHEGADATALAAMAHGSTVVILMGVQTLSAIMSSALESGVAPLTPVAIIENGSLPTERITRGAISTIVRIAHETGVKPPAVIVVGEVAEEGFLGSNRAATPR